MVARILLTGEWRYLAMLDYRVDPALLQPLVPRGTTLDQWQGATCVSLVGRTRVHREEAPLRPVLRQWSMTIADVYRADQPEGAAERARAWARTISREL